MLLKCICFPFLPGDQGAPGDPTLAMPFWNMPVGPAPSLLAVAQQRWD